MKKIIYLSLLFFFFPIISFAAIQRDFSAIGGNTTANSTSWNHTSATTSTIGFVGIYDNDDTTCGGGVTGVTWGGATMTQLDCHVDPASLGGGSSYDFYIISPPTGTQSIVASFSGSHFVYTNSASYTGSSITTSSVIDAHKSNGATIAASWSDSLTTTVDNDWIFVNTYDYTGGNQTAAGSEFRLTRQAGLASFDKGALTPAGSQAVAINGGSGASYYSWEMVAFAPAGGGGGGSSSTFPNSNINTPDQIFEAFSNALIKGIFVGLFFGIFVLIGTIILRM